MALRLTQVLLAVTTTLTRGQSSTLPLEHWQHTSWTGSARPPVPGNHWLMSSPDGYLWLSARNALLRFDGVRFTVFDSMTTPALAADAPGEITAQMVDRDGVMWIVGPGGMIATYQGGRFKQMFRSTKPAQVPTFEDREGLVWLADTRLFRRHDREFERYRLPPNVPDSGLQSPIRSHTGGLWVGSSNRGLWHISTEGVVRNYGRGGLRPIAIAGGDTVLVVGDGVYGVARLDDERIKTVLIPGESIGFYASRALVTQNGAAWIPSNVMGLIRIRNGIVDRFTSNNGLSDDRVHDVTIDGAGIIWVSTDAGLDRLRPSAFAALDPAAHLPFGVHAGYQTDATGALWFHEWPDPGTYLVDGGIVRGRPGSLSARRLALGALDVAPMIGASRGGGIWLGPIHGGVARVRRDGSVTAYDLSAGLPPKRIQFAVETRDGALWTRADDGEFGRVRNGRYRAFRLDGDDSSPVFDALEDSTGQLWLMQTAHVVTVVREDSIVASISVPRVSGEIQRFALEGRDTIWLTTQRGLYRIIDRQLTEVRAPALVPLLSVGAQLRFSRDHAWIASQSGIARVSRSALHRAAAGDSLAAVPDMLDELDGLPAATTSRIVRDPVRVAPDGRVWIATMSGVAVANPPDVLRAPDMAKVHIEEVSIGGRQVDGVAVIDPNPGRVEFRFTATGVALAERVQLEYQLDGADARWQRASLPRLASYTQLQPGSYTFRVRALGADGSPVSESSLAFRVLPAWYQSRWFIVACLLSVAGLGSSATTAWQRRRARRVVEAAQARFDAALAERARIGRELHDTLLQGFTGITLRLDSVRDALEERGDPVANELSEILTRADGTLREARESVWEIRSPESSRGNLGSALQEEGRRVLRDAHVVLRQTVTGTPRPLPPAIEATVLRVAREALFNALKHAHATSIIVRLTYEARHVLLDVIDDGQGTDAGRVASAIEGRHWGMTDMRERAQRAGGTFEVVTAPGQGMRISMSLPAEPAF